MKLRAFYAYRLLATSYLYAPIFMLFQESRGLSFAGKLALGGLYSAVIIIAEIPTGVLADRLGRRRAMLFGALAMIASCACAVTAYGFTQFAIAESLAAVSMALCSGADSAYLYDLLRDRELGHEYARREATASAWHLLGSAVAFLGGGALARIDLVLPYYATAAVAAAAAVVACLMEDDARPAPTREPALIAARAWGRHMAAAIGDVAKHGRLAWLVGYSAVVFVLLRATLYVYQPYLEQRGLGPWSIGVVYAVGSAVGALVAARTPALRRRFGDELLLWVLAGGLAASFLGLAGAARGPWMMSLLLVQAIANGLYSPLTKPLLNREISDSSRRAAVLSVESMARRAAMGVFSPLVGLYGEADVMVLCGVVGLGGLGVLAAVRMRATKPTLVDPR